MAPHTHGTTTTCAVEIYGHRGWGCSGVGASSVVPENSIAALNKAVGAGITGAEIDVWMTKDGEVLVIHGCGPGGRGMLHETTTVDEDAEGRCIQLLTVEELEKCHALTLTESWLSHAIRQGDKLNKGSWHGAAAIQVREEYHNLPCEEQKRLKEEWTSHKVPCPHGSRVPTLKEVFKTFHGRLKFNVELKGTNPEIGMKVLEIAAPYDGVIGRISSFCWVTPLSMKYSVNKSYSRKGSDWRPSSLQYTSPYSASLGDSKDEVPLDDNQKPPAADAKQTDSPANPYDNSCFDQPIDLLKPIVNNAQNVPLALLFEKGIPSVDVVRRCLNVYNAEWAHIPQASWDDMKSDVGPDGTIPLPVEKLRNFVEKLALSGKKVMTWWSSSNMDILEDIQLSIDAGVASICPNDVELALQATFKRP